MPEYIQYPTDGAGKKSRARSWTDPTDGTVYAESVTMGEPAATTGSLTGTGSVAADVAGYASAQIQLSGTYNAAVGFVEGSVDGGTVYNSIPFANGATPSSGIFAPTANTTYLLTAACGGLTHVRYRASVFSSGTLAIVILPSAAPTAQAATIVGGSVTADTELGTAITMSADQLSGTTWGPKVVAALYALNGSAWDRLTGDAANGLDIDVTRLPAASTASVANVAASASSVTLQAANTARKQLIITNASSAAILYIKFGSAATTTTSHTWELAALASWAIPTSPIYTGIVTGIWSAATGSGANVTEIT